MQCSNCGNVVQIGDRFCEECGASLTPDSPPNCQIIGCQKCGAKPEEIDQEGFCSICGFLNPKITPHHIEINIDSYLAGVSDIGVKRKENQDFLACAKIPENNTYILVVCDGVSSSESPEIAAKIAAETTCQSLVKAISNNLELQSAMIQGISESLEQVCLIPHQDSSQDASSTTIVTAIVQEKNVKIAWLGDSRAYWISPQESRLLTKDDSWFNLMVDSGKMTPEAALKSEYAHAITKWLGADVKDAIELSIIDFLIPSSGYLLLCSDGLWNYIHKVQDLANLIYEKSDEDALTLAKRLVEWAKLQGGHDNITVAVCSWASAQKN